jgi:hypothetical protein
MVLKAKQNFIGLIYIVCGENENKSNTYLGSNYLIKW